MRQRMAILPVAHRMMDHLLRLPEGYEVHTSYLMPDADAIGIVVRSAAFEPSPPGVYLPHMGAELHRCDACGGPVLDDIRYPVSPRDVMARIGDEWYR